MKLSSALCGRARFYVEHCCSHRMRFLWASHSVHHSSEKMLVTTAYRLSWTPILSGVFLFYLPIVWIGYDPVCTWSSLDFSMGYAVKRPCLGTIARK